MDQSTLLHPEESNVIQAFGVLAPVRLGLRDDARHKSVSALNRLLAHTIALRDLYRKSHWQTSGTTFQGLHQLFDEHYREQEQMMDALAERVQVLGGVALAQLSDVVSESRLARGPRGVEAPQSQLRRLVDAHEFILQEARPLAREAAAAGDDGTSDLIVSDVVRVNELQSWRVHRHLVVSLDA